MFGSRHRDSQAAGHVFGGLRLPDYKGIEPDRQRTVALERLVVRGPVLGLVGGGCGSAHALQPP